LQLSLNKLGMTLGGWDRKGGFMNGLRVLKIAAIASCVAFGSTLGASVPACPAKGAAF
jgi:hypothetical protein